MLFIVPLLLGGCSGISKLKENEYLLTRQRIQAPKYISSYDLDDLKAQEVNRKFLGIPGAHYLVGIYYRGLKSYDQEKFVALKEKKVAHYDAMIAATPEHKVKRRNNLEFKKQKVANRIDSKIEQGNNFMQWGEPVGILDSASNELTATRFREYLFSNGYFLGKVDYKVDSAYRRARVTYTLEPGRAYFIDTIMYDIPDPVIDSLVVVSRRGSLIRAGERYRQQNFIRERERLDFLLKDNGYYDFSRQYIEFDVDTAYRDDRKVAVRIVIKDPSETTRHKQFTLTEVNFVTDAGQTSSDTVRQGKTYHNINFSYYKKEYSLRLLSQRVFLQPGDLFSRTNTFDTQRQLANFDLFKFVNVNYDTAGTDIKANIYTNALDRYELSTEAGVSVTQGFPGPFVNASIKRRNIFKGLEIFDLTGHFGFEGVASATSDQNVYKSTEAGINASITFPQLLFPLKQTAQYRLGRYNPKTRFQVGYSYTDRPEYRRTYLSFAGTYSFQNKRTTQYSFTFANISIIDTLKISSAFREFLQNQRDVGNFSLVNSFNPSFLTSMIFGVSWNPDDYGNLNKNSVYIRGLLESGGTVWNFVTPKPILEDSLQIFQYLRFSFDLRRNLIVNRNTVLAYRVNLGLVQPYGRNRTIPYEKYFFVGGSNSVRAWRPRRLGPGSYKPNINPEEKQVDDGYFDYNIEKPAPILIEGSIELRKNLIGFLDGAVFLDAGNVWTIDAWEKKEGDVIVENGNSKFRLNQFYKEFGVGTGFGFRFDFAFLILRFDVGIKVYDPARDPGDRFVLNRARFFKPYSNGREPVIYNIGINYPF